MEAKIKTIWIDPAIAKELAEKISDIEVRPMGGDEYIGDFDFDIEKTINLFGHTFEMLIACFGKLCVNGKTYSHWYDCPPEFDLISQYLNNIDFNCFIDGEEVEFNSEEIQEKIEKIITK